MMKSVRSPLSVQALLTAACVALQIVGTPLGGPTGLSLSCAAILVLGLPHGALDLQLIQQQGRRGARGLAPLVVLYLSCALAAFLVWRASPVLALGLFLGMAIIHFAEDWALIASRSLSLALAAGLVSAPALLHREALKGIFLDLTGQPGGASLIPILALAAPPALMGSIAAIVLLARRQRAGQALAAAVSLLGLVLLPPVLGFALFFGLCHSPRHFKAALRTLSIKRAAGWLPLAAPTTLAALAIGGALFVRSGAATEPGRLVSATFMLLSILTVPHMAAPLLLTALAALDPSSRHPSAPSPRAAA